MATNWCIREDMEVDLFSRGIIRGRNSDILIDRKGSTQNQESWFNKLQKQGLRGISYR